MNLLAGERNAASVDNLSKCQRPQRFPPLPAPIAVPEPVQETIPEVVPVNSIPEALPASFVTFTANGQIRVHARNAAEAKLAIRELRARKKELSLSKRALMQQQRKIRAAYTDLVHRRGSKFIGGGSVGRIIRAFQTLNRDAARSQLANELAPLEQQRSEIEAWIIAIDSVIIQLQGCI